MTTDPDRAILLQIAAQARRLSAALENGQGAQDWASEKARLDALLASVPRTVSVAADAAAELHGHPPCAIPADPSGP